MSAAGTFIQLLDDWCRWHADASTDVELEELEELVAQLTARTVVFDSELGPVKQSITHLARLSLAEEPARGSPRAKAWRTLKVGSRRTELQRRTLEALERRR